MSTRVTTAMIQARVLADVNRVNDRISRTETKLSSGKEIRRPSDDPSAAARAMKLRDELDGVRQYQRNVDDARGWQDASESALAQITQVVQQVRDVMVQGGSDTATQEARDAIAEQIEQSIATIKELANASYKGQYLFAGVGSSTATDDAPFDPATADDGFRGPGGDVFRQIGPGVPVAINVPLDGVLAGGTGMLAALRGAAASLRAGDATAVRTGALQDVDTQLDALLEVRARNGARTNRLDSADTRLQELEETTLGQLSSTEDVDIAKAMIDFSSQQAALQASLRAGASIVQSSLMDFLR